MTHTMLDLETMGNSSNAAIVAKAHNLELL